MLKNRSFGGIADHLHIALVLVVHLDGAVGDLWWRLEELVLHSFVALGKCLSLIIGQGHQFNLLLLGHSSKLLQS